MPVASPIEFRQVADKATDLSRLRLFCSLFARLFLSLCRLNHDKVSQLPRKRGRATALVVPAFGLGACGGAAVAALVRAAIPGQDHRQLTGLRLERVEAAKRAAANDDFDGALLLLSGRGGAACSSGFRRHAMDLVSAPHADFFDLKT